MKIKIYADEDIRRLERKVNLFLRRFDFKSCELLQTFANDKLIITIKYELNICK